MPRRKPHEPYVQVKVNLPATLNALLEEQLWDPVLKKPRYGGRSNLFTDLARRWLEEQGVNTGEAMKPDKTAERPSGYVGRR